MDIDRQLLSEEMDRGVESLSEAFSARSVRHALIGGLAASIRGRPRLTQDVDLLIEVPQIELPGLLDDLIERGFGLDQKVVIDQFVRERSRRSPSARSGSTGSGRSSRCMPAPWPTPRPSNGPRAIRSGSPPPRG